MEGQGTAFDALHASLSWFITVSCVFCVYSARQNNEDEDEDEEMALVEG